VTVQDLDISPPDKGGILSGSARYYEIKKSYTQEHHDSYQGDIIMREQENRMKLVR
jgi:hypothetical protein